MRRKKERSKQGQTNKAKHHSTPKAVTFLRKMKSTKVQNPRRKCSAVVETNCLVAEYRIPYRIGPRTIITDAHRAPLIDMMGWATQRGPRPRLVATSHRLASCVIVSGFRAALDLNTYPLRNLIRPRCAERAKPG